MRKACFSAIVILLVTLCNSLGSEAQSTEPRLRVVATLPDYGVLASAIGGDRVTVQSIVRGDQDAHFIRPKPSFVNMVRNADVLIATGLDLELCLNTVLVTSGNNHVRSGQPGYVAVSHGMTLLEKPTAISRSEGGVHIYGNPHVTCSPIHMKVAARNIATGLIKNDPEGKQYYQQNLDKVLDEIDRRLFGEELIGMLGADTLCALAEKGTLIPFLREKEFQDKLLVHYLGGWMKDMLPLYGTPIVTYHKNWIYFVTLYGLEEAGTIEPKPGIPPSPRHVNGIVELMRARNIAIILAANYFDEQKIRTVAGRVGAEPVIVPLYVGGAPGVEDYFQLVDQWIGQLLNAAEKKGLLSQSGPPTGG